MLLTIIVLLATSGFCLLPPNPMSTADAQPYQQTLTALFFGFVVGTVCVRCILPGWPYFYLTTGCSALHCWKATVTSGVTETIPSSKSSLYAIVFEFVIITDNFFQVALLVYVRCLQEGSCIWFLIQLSRHIPVRFLNTRGISLLGEELWRSGRDQQRDLVGL